LRNWAMKAGDPMSRMDEVSCLPLGLAIV
jgi:hypothetical protein